jgi:basic amino acid/polyamine antiporter, APA family
MSLAPPSEPENPRQPSLLRALGPGMAIAIVVGNVIGSGIYVKPGGIARDAGDFRVIIAAWIIGGLICLLGSLCVAELGSMLPQAGGLYVYLREAYGRPIAFLFGWTDFLFNKPASIGALTVVFVGTLFGLAGLKSDPWFELAIETAIIVAMAWINVLGVIWGGRLQGGTTIAKAGFLAGVAILPFAMAFLGHVPLVTENLVTAVAPQKPSLSTQFAAALLGILWAYNGWEALGSVAEEIREPQKNIPRALFGGLGILIVLYVSANVAYHLALPMEKIVASGEHTAERMFEVLLGPGGRTLMAVGVLLSTFGGINSNTLLGPRVSFAMGRDGVFFQSLGWVHATYRTPAFAIIVQAAMAIGLVLASSILVHVFRTFGTTTVFDILTNYVVFASSIFYMLAVVGVVILRRTRPDLPRPYRTLAYPYVPVLYAAFYIWFLLEVYRGDPKQANIGLGLIALGIPVYLWWQRWGGGRTAGSSNARSDGDSAV